MNCGLPAPLKSFAATPREASCHVTTAHVLSLLLGTRWSADLAKLNPYCHV